MISCAKPLRVDQLSPSLSPPESDYACSISNIRARVMTLCVRMGGRDGSGKYNTWPDYAGEGYNIPPPSGSTPVSFACKERVV